MKILLDARFYGLENAGLGRYTINLISELSRLDRKNEYVVLLRKKYFDRLNLPGNWKKVLAEFRHYTFAEQIKLPRTISKENPDIAHFLSFNIPVFYEDKFIVTIHDLLMPKHRDSEGTTLPLYLFYPKHLAAKYAMRKAVEKAKKIIVPSNAVKDEIIQYYKTDGKKTKVIYEGVNIKFKTENLKLKIEKPYFTYVGNAYPHKNLARLIKAVVRLNEVSKYDVSLVIASSRDIFTVRLEKQIKKMGASKYVRLLGFVPDSKLGVLYKNSLAFVYPSLSEGFGLPGLEALASGTLTLASDIPVFKEVYQDKVFYFDPYSVESMIKAMDNVIKMDEQERGKRIVDGQEFAKRYSWSKMAKETLKIYEDSARLR